MNHPLPANTSVAATAVVRNSVMHDYARLKEYAELINSELGAYSYLSQNTLVNKTIIGKFCSIGHGSYIGLWEHNTAVSTHSFYLYETSGGFVKGFRDYEKCAITTHVGNDVWIGANSVVLKGRTIGDGAIVGAGSIVTRDVPPYAIVAGNPARLIKYRFSPDDIAFLTHLQWWHAPREVIQSMVDHALFDSLEALRAHAEQQGWENFATSAAK
jgi:acetyltransferase-like isoleucine patch superfamily enzyme